MVINTNNDASTSAQARHKASEKASVSATGSREQQTSSTKDSDKVELSLKAQQLQSLEGLVNASEGFDNSKVESIKQKIANGEYTINSERIAAKMLQHDALL